MKRNHGYIILWGKREGSSESGDFLLFSGWRSLDGDLVPPSLLSAGGAILIGVEDPLSILNSGEGALAGITALLDSLLSGSKVNHANTKKAENVDLITFSAFLYVLFYWLFLFTTGFK